MTQKSLVGSRFCIFAVGIYQKTYINKRYIKLLKETHDHSTAIVKTDNGETRKINILKGVKQGDVLYAVLFCVVIALIIQKADEECHCGASIGGHRKSNLSYADDIAVLSNSVDGLQKSLHRCTYSPFLFGRFTNQCEKDKCQVYLYYTTIWRYLCWF